MHKLLTVLSLVAMAALVGCGPGTNSAFDGGGDDDGIDAGLCDNCQAQGLVCAPGLGCRECVPGNTYCSGTDDSEVWRCNDDGWGGVFQETCAHVCQNGYCVTECERAEETPSNVGCHFYAVDLDNEAYSMDIGGVPMEGDAASMQYSVVLANNDPYDDFAYTVYRNTAPFGQPVVEEVVHSGTVPHKDVAQIDLPQREVDGSMGQNGAYEKNSGSGTFVSSHAYRIETTGPVVAYQFNPIVQAFTNGASILIPRQAIGTDYYVLGFPTANPCGMSMFPMDSIPDHTAFTIVGTQEDTDVTIYPTHPVTASAGASGIEIPATAAGGIIQVTIGPYDVVNIESEQPVVDNIMDCVGFDGDFTGTKIESSKAIVVFSSTERGLGTGGADVPDPPVEGWDDCCTEHFEQQMFPTNALGWKFAVSRSPVRSDPPYVEPDIYRILATVDGTVVNTSLPAPYNTFTLNAGEYAPFWADTGFIVESTNHAIMVGQYLVSQGRTVGGIGDPDFIVFPAAEQHRKEYVFLVPTTFQDDYFVLTMPEGAGVSVNDQPLPEFHDCVQGPVGMLDGINYVQLTCPVEAGHYTVASDQPVGLTVYGYYSVGSYGFPGGSDVRNINPVE